MRPVRSQFYVALVTAGLACCATFAPQFGVRPELRESRDVDLRNSRPLGTDLRGGPRLARRAGPPGADAPKSKSYERLVTAAASETDANAVGEGAPAAAEGAQRLLATLTGVLSEARERDCAELEHDLREGVAALCAAGHRALARSAVEDWLKGENADHIGFSVLETAALTGDSFEDAARWLGQLPPSLLRDAALAQIITRWSATAPRAALDSAAVLPLETRLRIVPPIVAAWSEREAIAATEWVAAHDEREATDAIIGRVLTGSTLAQRHPQAAARWLDLIRDSTLRREVQASLARTDVPRFRE